VPVDRDHPAQAVALMVDPVARPRPSAPAAARSPWPACCRRRRALASCCAFGVPPVKPPPGRGRRHRDRHTAAVPDHDVYDRAGALPADQLGRQLVGEPRGACCTAVAPGRPGHRAGQVQPLRGPGDADVGQPALLLQLRCP
jgi:hypothetical protein